MIFVGGYPRTGTTLAHALLCGDDRTNGFVGECTFIEFLLTAYSQIGEFPVEHAFTDYWKDHDDFHYQIKGLLDKQIETFKEIHQCEIPVFKRPQMTPYLYILAGLYPDAKFVVTVRDPRDVAASLKQVRRRYLLSDGKHPDPFLTQPLFEMVTAYSATMMKMTADSDIYDGRLMYVKYEGLVNYPDTMIPRMEEFTGLNCKLTWEDVEFEKDRVFYSPMWSKPITNKRIGRWK